ncbi:TPA: hypothetical protein ENX78_09490 [Candidatus Poribacteria bacterium]|nr:hypothetical protein [Candidatus Poribacteria bacterium]
MTGDRITLSYFSEPIQNKIKLSYKDIRKEISDKIYILLKDKNSQFLYKPDKKIISVPNSDNYFNGWEIVTNFLETKLKVGEKFRNDHFRILLSFTPSFDNTELNKLRSDEIKDHYKKALEILDYLDEDLTIEIGNQNISFTRLILDSEVKDFYNSEVVLWGRQNFQLIQILSRDSRNVILRKVFEGAKQNVNNIGIVFTDDLEDALIDEVKNKFKDLGFQISERKENKKVVLSNLANYSNTVVFSKSTDDEMNYIKWKIWTLRDKVITQTLRKDQYNGAEWYNIKMECLHKVSSDPLPLELDPKYEPDLCDGYIYLSRITEYSINGSENLLGVIVTFGKHAGSTEEKILTLEDRPLDEDQESDRDRDDSKKEYYVAYNVDKVVEDIISFYGIKGKKMIILLSKRISYENAEKLYETFQKSGVTINKIIYLSSLHGSVTSNLEVLEYGDQEDSSIFYKIIDNKHLFYQPSSKVSRPFDFGTIYSEVLYPLDGKFTEKDVISLIRLAKKRLYRIYNVGSLRIPEPIVIFRNKSEIIEKLDRPGIKLPTRYLI